MRDIEQVQSDEIETGPHGGRNSVRPTYVRPGVVSYSDDDILKMLGPAQAINSKGMIVIDQGNNMGPFSGP